MEKYIRKVTRVGKRSFAIIIPSEIADKLQLRERQKMVVHEHRRQIIIKDWKKS